MPAGVHNVEPAVFQTAQIRDVRFDEFNTKAQFAGPPARNRQLFRRNVNRGDSRSQSGESEYREIVAAAQDTDLPAFHVSDQIQLMPEKDLSGIPVSNFPRPAPIM